MDPASYINVGFLKEIFNTEGDPETGGHEPVLQCVRLDPMPNNPDRYRVVFSDINNFVQGMLAVQVNPLVKNGTLRTYSLVRLRKFTANRVKGKRIFIVLELDVLQEFDIRSKIGDPQSLAPKVKDDSKAQPQPIPSKGFYGDNPEQKHQAPQQSLPSRTNVARNNAHGNIYPIEAVSPYAHKWTIKARVTSKSEVKTWHNRNGEGKLFSINLLDESGEIKATGFNEQCEAFYDVFQEGEVYYISSPCRVVLAKKQFSNLNNDYEMTFERETVIEKAEEQDGVPQVRYNFMSIGELSTVEKDAIIDTIGILKELGEVSQIVSKTTSKPYDKRELTLVDNTNFSVRVTIWGNSASSFDAPLDSVIAFKGVKVSDFGGRSLSLLSSGTMSVNPDIDEAYKLKGWYDAQGRNDAFETHAGMGGGAGAAGGRQDAVKTVSQVKDEQLGMEEGKTDYFALKATIVYIKPENASYPACASPDCSKRVTEDPAAGGWRCERCDKTHPNPEHRYIMSLNIADHTGQIWVSCFDDVGRMVMGITAAELIERNEKDVKAGDEVFANAIWRTYTFRCRAKLDTFQDQQRVRYQIFGASPINFVQESKKLVDLIKAYD